MDGMLYRRHTLQDYKKRGLPYKLVKLEEWEAYRRFQKKNNECIIASISCHSVADGQENLYTIFASNGSSS